MDILRLQTTVSSKLTVFYHSTHCSCRHIRLGWKSAGDCLSKATLNMQLLHSFQVVVAFLYQNEFYMGNSQLSLGLWASPSKFFVLTQVPKVVPIRTHMAKGSDRAMTDIVIYNKTVTWATFVWNFHQLELRKTYPNCWASFLNVHRGTITSAKCIDCKRRHRC